MAIDGNRIRLLREDLGLTQEELGKKLGFIKQTVSSWENNISEPNGETISKIASLFNVSVDYIFGNDRHDGAAILEKYEYLFNLYLRCCERSRDYDGIERCVRVIDSYRGKLYGMVDLMHAMGEIDDQRRDEEDARILETFYSTQICGAYIAGGEVRVTRPELAGAKMSCIRAWLDDRGKPYKEVDGALHVGSADRELIIEFSFGDYLVNGQPYKSQRAVINERLNPFYGRPYKEV